MLRLMFSVLTVAVMLVLHSCKATKETHAGHSHENLIIYYDPEAGNEALLKAAKRYGSDILL